MLIAAFALAFSLLGFSQADATTLTTQAAKVATPAKVTISSVKSSKAGQIAVTAKKAKKAKGYQYVVSQSKKFSGSTTKKAKTTKRSYTFKSLTQGKKYYVKVRAYNKPDKTTKWGKWS
ncbi:MAG: fibronectin type III domain-containing protein, partial [Eggerthellaceae bacterium]|nr:fibronectin type III domain-containing protein [Eggerthellaceae bacterium]